MDGEGGNDGDDDEEEAEGRLLAERGAQRGTGLSAVRGCFPGEASGSDVFRGVRGQGSTSSEDDGGHGCEPGWRDPLPKGRAGVERGQGGSGAARGGGAGVRGVVDDDDDWLEWEDEMEEDGEGLGRDQSGRVGSDDDGWDTEEEVMGEEWGGGKEEGGERRAYKKQRMKPTVHRTRMSGSGLKVNT